MSGSDLKNIATVKTACSWLITYYAKVKDGLLKDEDKSAVPPGAIFKKLDEKLITLDSDLLLIPALFGKLLDNDDVKTDVGIALKDGTIEDLMVKNLGRLVSWKAPPGAMRVTPVEKKHQ